MYLCSSLFRFCDKNKSNEKGRIPSEEADLNFRDAKKFYRTPIIISKEAIKVIRGALQIADLKQKQIICLGLIAQYESISAANLIRILNLKDRDALSPWLDPLLEYNIVHSVGSRKAKEYRISTHILRQSEYKGKTTLKRIEDYRIKELIIEDLRIYKCAPLKDIHQRIGKEIAYKKILAQIKSLVRDGIIEEVGVNRWVQYRLIPKT